MNENGNITKYNLLRSEGALWQSAAIAAMKLAVDIKNEAPSTNHHQERLQWAYQILANPDQWVSEHRWDIIANPTIASNGHTSADGDIEFVVAGLVPV
jgi:hypothetical protein